MSLVRYSNLESKTFSKGTLQKDPHSKGSIKTFNQFIVLHHFQTETVLPDTSTLISDLDSIFANTCVQDCPQHKQHAKTTGTAWRNDICFSALKKTYG